MTTRWFWTGSGSRCLASIDYMPATQMLDLQFRSGKTYRYTGVPPGAARRLIRGHSKGRAFHHNIYQRYPYVRL